MSPDQRNKPDFIQVITAVGLQAMIACGRQPNPATGQLSVDLPLARYHIGTLEVLSEKTRGNLSTQESLALAQMLHQIRLAYLAAKS